MRYCARQLGASLSRGATRAALALVGDAQSGRVATVAGGLRIEREFDRIILDRPVRSAERAGDRPLSIEGPSAGAGDLFLGGVRWRVRWAPGPGDGPGIEAFDPAALAFPLELRAWRPGDRIRLAYGAKKLKKLFAERRIGRSARESVPVVAEQGGAGRVLWVAGVARAACARAREGGPAWHITVEHEQHD
jgi:tRNA(Ile)-lysidine synthetase-like protein